MTESELKEKWDARVHFKINETKMKAWVDLYNDDGDEAYDFEEFTHLLSLYGITFGVRLDEVKRLINDKKYSKNILIAEGEEPVEGQDGYFEYFFNINPEIKPIVLEDGSVDYNTLGRMELRKEGDLLITYHPAVLGINGTNIYGQTVAPARVKEMKPYRGKGFTLSEDNRDYYASTDGRVELKDGKLFVKKLYEIEGDVDATTGDVYFNGDILIHGNVLSNVKVEAVGNLTIQGHVEIANLIAGKDIILKNGMQGAGKGKIHAKGNVSAKFLEQTQVTAYGEVHANAIMNCEIYAGKFVEIAGKRGAIIGGSTQATEYIMASVIGNRAGISTQLRVGVDENYYEELEGYKEQIEHLKEEMVETEKQLKIALYQSMKNPVDYLIERRNYCLREKIKKESQLRENEKKKEELLDKKRRSKDAKVLVSDSAYPNIVIMINGAYTLLNGECKNVTIRNVNREIHIYSNT